MDSPSSESQPKAREPSHHGADAAFRAFISYSHHDSAFAHRLHERLERYRVPKALVGKQTAVGVVPRGLAPIFRDRDELPSAPDLGAKITEALFASLFLVVVASPWSARSRWVDQEVRAFKAMDRADRVLVIIVDGEPNASDRQGLEAQECFCPALRFAVDSKGDLTSIRAEPIAADARKGGDGRDDAVLKVIAGLIGVSLGRLKQREKRRERHRRLLISAFGGLAVFAAIVGYIALCDLNVPVPGGRSLRTELDHFGLTLFRPVAKQSRVAADLAQSRALMRARLIAVVTRPNWFHRAGLTSVWEFAQVASALASNPDATPADIAEASRQLTAALDVLPPKQIDGRWFGWPEPDDVVRSECSLWVLIALSATIPRDATMPDATRVALLRLLDIAEQAAEWTGPFEDGGWNDVPRRNDPTDHNAYSTSLALHALVDLRQAGLCWRGDCAKRDAMIAKTAGRLIQDFVDEKDDKGWCLDRGDDRAPSDDLSALVVGALGRAALVSGLTIPPAIRDFAYVSLASFDERPYQPSAEGITKFSVFDDWRGQTRQASLPSRLFWVPWTVTAITAWQRIAVRDGAPSELRRGLARSLGHIAIDLAPPMRAEMIGERTLPYVTAETMAGLDRAL